MQVVYWEQDTSMELEILAFFNHHDAFQFLNYIENRNQKDLPGILLTLRHDYINNLNSTDTLSKCKLPIEHTSIQKPDSKIGWKILDDFYLAGTEAIKTKCGQEYGFVDENEKTRVTVLSELHIDELENLPKITLQQKETSQNLIIYWRLEKAVITSSKRKPEEPALI